MQLSNEAVAAINAAFADPDAGWAFTSAQVSSHSQLAKIGEELAMVAERSVTLMCENESLGRAMVFFLEGHGDPPATTVSLVIMGTRLSTTDATLITRCEGAIALLEEAAQTSVIEFFTPFPDEEI